MEAVSNVADSRSSSDEVEKELLILVVQTLVNGPEPRGLFMICITVVVNRHTLKQFNVFVVR